jgi:hypothetical protein
MFSIEENGANVHKEQAAQNTNRHNGPVTNETSVNNVSIIKARAVTGLKGNNLLLAKELKETISFKALLEADKHQFQQSGKYVKCRCPFHPDSTPSFFINIEEDTCGKCYGCNWYGDIFKYEMEFHKVDFKTAWFQLNDFFYQCPRAGRKARTTPKKARIEKPQFTDKQAAERKKYADRLAKEPGLAEEVCRKRFERSGETWNPDIIQKLAQEGSLGWADCLAFIYPAGTKYRRWPGKDILWECKCLSLWRGHLLAEAKHVYLTESETDAIALIHAGIEQMEGAAVIAAPSATSFLNEWAPLFQGKIVTFCFDNDQAGEEGMKRVASLLQPYANELRAFEMKEVI